jgi:hypothetical protein
MKGTAWMSTGKLETMTALLMRDGRYDDAVAIVPFSLVNTIGTAFEAYKKATLVQQFKDSYLDDRKRKFEMPAPTLVCCLQSTISIMPYDKKQIRLPINSEKKQRPR